MAEQISMHKPERRETELQNLTLMEMENGALLELSLPKRPP